jgi:transposase
MSLQLTSSTSVTSVAPVVPSPRPRGAQKNNTNARRHGAYSQLNPSRLAQLTGMPQMLSSSARPAHDPIPSQSDQAPSSQDPTLLALRTLNLEFASLFNETLEARDTPLMCVAARHFVRTTLKINRHMIITYSESFELRKIALYAIVLPIWQFKQYHGVTRDACQDPPLTLPLSQFVDSGASFRLELKKTGQKSTPTLSASPDLFIGSSAETSLLTSAQVQLLAHLLPSASIKGQRGRPPASSLDILNAILWKVAHALAWDQLPERFPPARTCRRYYKRWLLNGRLLTIYKILLKDLLVRGRADPRDFVKDGCFRITSDHRVSFTPECPDTWQAHTALLFFQQSYALIRRIRRETKDKFIL